MTAGQKARLGEKFADNYSLTHHGGSSGLAEHLNGLGDEKTVCASEVAVWWGNKQRIARLKGGRQDVKGAKTLSAKSEVVDKAVSLCSNVCAQMAVVGLQRTRLQVADIDR